MAGDLRTFRAKPGYQFFYSLPVLLALALLVDIVLAPEGAKVLVFVLVLVAAAVTAPLGWARVVLDHEQLSLQAPLRKPRTLERRQLVSFEESSRLWRSLILRYHPIDGDGGIDRDMEAFLSLPPLDDQPALEAWLRDTAQA
jgi:hypothetical protein